MTAIRRSAPIAAWSLALVGVLVVMTRLGHGALAAPALRSPGTWRAWLAGRGAPDAVMALLRLVVLLLAGYLLAVTTLGVVVRLGRRGRLVSAADVVTLPFVRSLVQAGLGLGLAGATASMGIGGLAAAPARPEQVVLLSAAEEAPPVMQKLPDAAPAPASAPVEARTWRVAAGEHLWSIATEVLAESWGRSPSERELVPYWRQVIEANRPRLSDPGNPDLLFPGQELVVPAPPAAP